MKIIFVLKLFSILVGLFIALIFLECIVRVYYDDINGLSIKLVSSQHNLFCEKVVQSSNLKEIVLNKLNFHPKKWGNELLSKELVFFL
jgi:hypothetical protein